MSLLDSMYEAFTFYDKTHEADGEGGTKYSYVPGSSINAIATLDSSMEARVAEANGVKNVYTITVAKNVSLEYHDVLKRVSDGKIFRVTSDGDDKKTPASATLNMRQVSAEEWEIPT